MKKKKKNDDLGSYSLKPLLNNPLEFYVMSDPGLGFRHSYTIKEWETESGTLYTIEYANSSDWHESLQGCNIARVLDTGNGYVFIDTIFPQPKIDYDDFFVYTALFNYINNKDVNRKFSYRIMKVDTLFESKF